MPVRKRYEGVHVGFYRLDLVVDGKIVVEIMAVECIHEFHIAVALAYLKATQLQIGLIINFSGSIMRSRRVFRENDGVKEGENTQRKDASPLLPLPTPSI